jgi:hypothetical protein
MFFLSMMLSSSDLERNAESRSILARCAFA